MPLSAGYEDAAEAKKTLRAITAGQACVQLVLLAWQASPVLFLGLEPHPAAYILPPLGICCVSAGSLGISKPGSQGKLMLLLFQHLSGVLAVGVRSRPLSLPHFPPCPSLRYSASGHPPPAYLPSLRTCPANPTPSHS